MIFSKKILVIWLKLLQVVFFRSNWQLVNISVVNGARPLSDSILTMISDVTMSKYFLETGWTYIVNIPLAGDSQARIDFGQPWFRQWLYQCWFVIINTLRPRHNGRHFADDIFKCIFLNENIWISLKISLKFVPEVRINNIPALVQIMAWRRSGDKPLSGTMMVSLLTHICVTRPQWIKVQWNTSHIWKLLLKKSVTIPTGQWFENGQILVLVQELDEFTTKTCVCLGTIQITGIKNNARVTVNNNYWVTSEAICQ